MDPLLRSSTHRAPQQAARVNTPVTASASGHGGMRKKALIGIVAVAVCLIAVSAAGLWWAMRSSEASDVKSDRYQAVFLTNGQIYFGKITALSADRVRISGIYYLQANQSVQQTNDDKNAEVDTASKPQLVKLGNELHAPEDEMQINRDHVLFWENIKPDGQVAKAISDFTKK